MFDPTKPVETRDGRKARILCTDSNDPAYPLVALVADEEGEEQPQIYTSQGSFTRLDREHPLDLLNVPEKTEEFVNVYPKGICVSDDAAWVSTGYSSAKAAALGQTDTAPEVFTLKLTRTEGVVTGVELANA